MHQVWFFDDCSGWECSNRFLVNETISSEQTDSETDEVNTMELEAILPKRLNQECFIYENTTPSGRTSLDKINKNSKSTESHQSGWSDDHVSISSSDYQTSSKINKTETSKSSDDLEKDHGNETFTSQWRHNLMMIQDIARYHHFLSNATKLINR